MPLHPVYEQEVRDPIHKSIPFTPRERLIIDHPVVQRLRAIRSLGFVFLVYPGATNDRFTHSLGVMHLAGRIFTQIVNSQSELFNQLYEKEDLSYFLEIVRLAGLLHDVGHPPLSHSLEGLLPALGALPLPRTWYRHFDPDKPARHEDLSVGLISHLSHQPRAPLSRKTAQDIAALIHSGITPATAILTRSGKQNISLLPLLRNIITGEIDADRMDYLLRDSHYAGVTYGQFDLERILQSVTAILPASAPTLLHLALEANALYTFEDFLLARYHMFLQVYFHKTAPVFDYYLKQAFRTGEMAVPSLKTWEDFLAWQDESLWHRLRTQEGPWCRRIVGRVPSKLLMSSKGQGQDIRRLQEVRAMLDAARIPTFTCTSRQYLSKLIAEESPAEEGAPEKPAPPTRECKPRQVLYLVKHWMGRSLPEPVERDSSLIQRYNQVINIVNLYCLREHGPTARKLLEKKFEPQQLRLTF